MFRNLIAAAVILSSAGVCIAGDAGEEVIPLDPPQENDVFADASLWQPAAPSGTGRHGNPAAIAARMDASEETVRLEAR